MDILLINKYFWRKGGSETVFFQLLEKLNNCGHKAIPFSMKDFRNMPSEYSEYFVNNVDYTNSGLIKNMGNAMKILYSIEARNKMKALIDSTNVDISNFHIFQHQISPSVFSPLKKKAIPIILTLHDLKPICPTYKMLREGRPCELCSGGHFYNCFVMKCVKDSYTKSLVNVIEMYLHYNLGYYQNYVDRYIALSQFYKDKMVEAGFDQEKISLVPNCIDVEQMDFSRDEEAFLLYVGRLTEEKGIFTLLKAMKVHKDKKLVIVGEGPQSDSIRKYIIDNDLFNISLVGHKHKKEVFALLSRCCGLILPSEWYENCPMVVLEAHALAKPVIASNIGGIPELVQHRETGLLFHPGDHEELVIQINTLMLEKKNRREWGEEGRKLVRIKNNPDTWLENTLGVYRSVL